jgi:hypothetical protein
MDARTLMSWLKSATGRFVLMWVILGIVLVIIYYFTGQWHKVEAKATDVAQRVRAAAAAVTIETPVAPYNPPKPEAETPPQPARVPPPPPREERQAPLPITLFTSQQEHLSSDFAPYGRLLSCELVNTVDSSRIATPIIGLLLEDVWHAGRRIVPAGTEIHGSAQTDRARERIATQGNWTLVWTDGSGRELPVQGIGLDMARDDDGWSITDGSAGLRGYVIKTDSLAEIKLFAATFLSGAAAGLTDVTTIETDNGSILRRSQGSLQNAAATGAASVLQQYAQQVLQRIREDGFYIRVPAGTTFYLYIQQPLDLADARAGGSRSQPPKPTRLNPLP